MKGIVIKDFDRLQDECTTMKYNLLRILDGLDSTEQTEELKVQIKHCEYVDDLLKYGVQVLELIL